MPANNINSDKWVSQYATDLYRHAYLKVRNREVAEDLVQETFLGALNGKESFMGNSTEKTWLFAILKNKILDYWKKKSTTSEKLSKEEDFRMEYYFDEKGHWNTTVKELDDFETRLEKKNFRNILDKCTDKLSGKTRLVFIYKLIEEMESDIICKELGLTASNYWVMMHRAKLAVRACLEKNWL